MAAQLGLVVLGLVLFGTVLGFAQAAPEPAGTAASEDLAALDAALAKRDFGRVDSITETLVREKPADLVLHQAVATRLREAGWYERQAAELRWMSGQFSAAGLPPLVERVSYQVLALPGPRPWVQAAMARTSRLARVKVELAGLASLVGDLAGACQLLEEVLVAEPANAAAVARLATLCQQQGDRPRSIELYRKVVTTNPGDVMSRFLLAGLLDDMGDLDGAIEQFTAILAVLPQGHMHRPGVEAMKKALEDRKTAKP